MKLDPCRNCQSTVKYITAVPQVSPTPNVIVVQCGSCDTVFQIDEPEGWKEAGQNLNARNAREQGTSYVRDIRPEDSVRKTLKDLQNIPSDKIDEKFVANVAAKHVLETMLSNLVSKRPTVRQRSAEALAKIVFKPAQTSVDVTSGGKALGLQNKTTEELMAHTAGVIARLAALNDLEVDDEDSSTDR